jgi:hypothetical protein
MTSRFPHYVVRHKQSEQELWAMRCWCTEHIGPQWSIEDRNWGKRNGTWSVIWCGPENFRNYQWMFKNEADAVLFALRWS